MGGYFSTVDSNLHIYETATLGKYGSTTDNYISALKVNRSELSYSRTELFNGQNVGNAFAGPKIKFADDKYIYAKKVGHFYDVFMEADNKINLTHTEELDEMNPGISQNQKHVAFVDELSIYIFEINQAQRDYIESGVNYYTFSPNSQYLAYSTFQYDLHLYDVLEKKRSFCPTA
jgi:hypothetical protein